MNTSGCPACCWLLCLQYICVVLNHLASPTLQGICPVQALQGTTPDVSFMLHFSFYEPVYYRIDSSEPDLNFPSSSNEKKGYWVGFANNQGDSLTWRILTEDTQKIMAKIIDIDDHGQPLEDIKFKLKISKDQAEEIMSYNQLMDYIQKGTDAEEDPDSLFKFRDIVAHQGPLESTDPNLIQFPPEMDENWLRNGLVN